jgi:hypothetical protein
VITDATSSLSQATITVSQLLKPYPHFIGLTTASLPNGRSHYDSLQVQATRRLSQGLYFGVAYTFSKFMEATSYLNANDAKPSSLISDSDRPQRLVLHGIYDLPFGSGKQFLNSSNPIMRRLVGGWQINWVVTYQKMQALSFSGAERIRKSDDNPKMIDQWFDVRQFVPQEPFTLRTLSSLVADLRAAGLKKWDLTLMKKIPLTESVNFDFRAEFYNAWNTPHFGAPNTTVTSANFGRITGTLSGGGPREIQLAARISF